MTRKKWQDADDMLAAFIVRRAGTIIGDWPAQMELYARFLLKTIESNRDQDINEMLLYGLLQSSHNEFLPHIMKRANEIYQNG